MADTQSTNTILITGCSTGIGAACSIDLDRLGYRVFAGVRKSSDGDRLRQLASERLTPILLDVTDPDQIQAAVVRVAERVGESGLDGLVNNAGIVVPGPMELLSTEQFRHQLEVNLLGPHAITRAFLPLIREAQGRIVMVSSINGRIAPPYMGAYAASKHALEAMTDAMRPELRRWKIQLSLIEPDSVDTPIWEKYERDEKAFQKDFSPEILRYYEDDMQTMRQATRKLAAVGMPAKRVVKAIRHALFARRPRARYRVGFRVKLAVFGNRMLKERQFDWILLRVFGLK